MSRTAIHVNVANVTEEGVTFNVQNMRYEVLGENLTAEQIAAREDWHVYITVHPMSRDLPEIQIKNSREPLRELAALNKELLALNDEQAMATGERYKVLTEPGGLISRVESKITLYQLLAYVVTCVTLGVAPREMRDMGLC